MFEQEALAWQLWLPTSHSFISVLIQIEKDRNKRLRYVCTVLNEMVAYPFPAVCYFKYLLGINSPRIKLLCSIFIVMKIIIMILRSSTIHRATVSFAEIVSQSKVYYLEYK